MNGNSRPSTELLLAQAKIMSQRWENEERNCIENKDRANSDRDVFLIRIDNRAHRRDSGPATDRGTGGNEQAREARPGETGTTRFGMEGDDSDGAGSGGMVQEEDGQ